MFCFHAYGQYPNIVFTSFLSAPTSYYFSNFFRLYIYIYIYIFCGDPKMGYNKYNEVNETKKDTNLKILV